MHPVVGLPMPMAILKICMNEYISEKAREFLDNARKKVATKFMFIIYNKYICSTQVGREKKTRERGKD